MIEKAARVILNRADRAGVSIPREPQTTLEHQETVEEPTLDDRTNLDRATEITGQIGQIVYPAFSFDRGEGVRYTSTRSGTCKPIWVCERSWLLTRAPGVSFTNHNGSGRRADALTEIIFAT
jgi:hypothetical protein